MFADTNVRDHPSFVARARSQPCLCPIPCIVDTHRVGTPTCVEFESITNLSVPLYLSLSLPSTHTLRTVPIFFYFRRTYACTHVGTCSYSVSFLLGSGINGTGEEWTGGGRGLFVGIIGRFEGGKEVVEVDLKERILGRK